MNISLTEEEVARKERLKNAPQFKLKWNLSKSILALSLYNIITREKKK